MIIYIGFPDGSVGKEAACRAGDIGDVGLILGLEDPLEKEMKTYYSILAHGQSRLVGYIPKGHRELDMTEHIHKCMYLYISIYVFSLRYHGVARVEHNLATKPLPLPHNFRDIWLI